MSSLRIAASLLGALSLLAAYGTTATSCGPAPESQPQEETSEVDGVSPYRNFRGGDVRGENNFATLINNYAEAKHSGWAGSFWPYTANGIATNAVSGGGGGMGYSPAGRYDAARGIRDAQPWEVKMHGAGVKGVQGWWGHCNGWCVASALFPEPREPVTVNGITFGVGDLKGILSEAGMSASADFFGNRVDPWTREYQKAMNDTAADQYFLVLTNYMGKLKQLVLIDRFTGDQVWNQPLAGYRFKYPTKADDKGCTTENGATLCKINLESTLWWYNDSGVPHDVITPEFKFQDEYDSRSGAHVIEHRDLRFELWTDAPTEWDAEGKRIVKSGNVIVTRDGDYYVGGAWMDGGDYSDGHPDYMWVPYSIVPPDPNDDYANPHIDIEWAKKHLLVPGGADDPTASPRPIESAPSPRPSTWPTQPTPTGGVPTSFPTTGPTSGPPPIPIPFPTFTPNPRPIPGPTSPGSPSNPGGPSVPSPPSTPSRPGTPGGTPGSEPGPR